MPLVWPYPFVCRFSTGVIRICLAAWDVVQSEGHYILKQETGDFMRGKDEEIISLDKAMGHIMEIEPLKTVSVPLDEAAGMVLAGPVAAHSSCPSVDSSLKDGFAVISEDIQSASPSSPVSLRVTGSVTAGASAEGLYLEPGTAIRIMTGSPVPKGATAVVAAEFTRDVQDGSGRSVQVVADAFSGRNILRKGEDIEEGELLLEAGRRLEPPAIGLLAAAGVSHVQVYRLPEVVIAAVGSELVMPGEPVRPGQIAASNMITLRAELQKAGIHPTTVLFKDNLESLKQSFQQLLDEYDVILTCGGVLDGDKDFTVRAMEELGVEMIFRRVRIGPGKGVCMGMRGKKLIINLPGGPPSNHVAAVVLGVPGVKRLMGNRNPFPARVSATFHVQMKGVSQWTQFAYVKLEIKDGVFHVKHPGGRSRLMDMALSDGLAELPVGQERIDNGDRGVVWLI